MWRLSSLISLLLAGFIGIGVLVVREFRAGNRLNIILITVESLRYDLVNEVNTPGLLTASEIALRFDQHHAVSAWTGTNIISLLTGLTPFESGVHTRGQSVKPELHLPLEQLNENGYTVAGLQEFMTMDLYKNFGLAVEEPGADLLYWLAGQQVEKAPFFLWKHYVHTHLPYWPAKGREPDWQALLPEPKSESIRRIRRVIDEKAIPAGPENFLATDTEAIHALHSSTIKEFDAWFDGFWSFFKHSGLSRNTMLILTADHGDEHGERGNAGHASTNHAGHLYDEIVHVPLFIWLPERLQRKISKRSVEVLTSHTDIMPTILSLLNLKPSHKLSGRNLLTAGGKTQWTAMTSGAGLSEQDPENIGYYMYGCRQGKYWKTWIVPYSPFRIRVAEAGSDDWSDWIRLEALQ